MKDLWVICALPLHTQHTKSITKKFYGIGGSMGFQGYGLGGLRLYEPILGVSTISLQYTGTRNTIRPVTAVTLNLEA